MALYNLTSITDNTTTIIDLIITTNRSLAQGWLGTIWIIMLSIITLLAFYKSTDNFGKSLAATSFLCMIYALFFRLIDLIADKTLYIIIILCAATLATTWVTIKN